MSIQQKKSLNLIFILFILFFVSGCATTMTLNQLKKGHRYVHTGQYEKSIESYEKSMSHAEKIIIKDLGISFIANNENNIGGAYMQMGQYDKAMEYFNKSLITNKNVWAETNKMTAQAANFNNIAQVYLLKHQYKEAMKFAKEALAVNKKIKRNKGIALNLFLIGTIYRLQDQYNTAISYFKQALEFANNPDWASKMDLGYFLKEIVSTNLLLIGHTYYEQKNYQEAINYLEQAADKAEELRELIKEEDKLDYQVLIKCIYQLMTSSYIKNGDVPNAYKSIERGRAKLLAERLNNSSKDIIIPFIKEIQEEMDEKTAILIYANTYREDMVNICITKNNVHCNEISTKNSLQPTLKKHKTAIKNLLENQDRVKFAKKKDAMSLQLIEKENDYLERIVEYYHTLLSNSLPINERDIAIKKKYKDIKQDAYRKQDDNTKKISNVLYNFLIKPNKKYIKEKEKLVIIPDGMLAFLPFETLINDKQKYLVQNYKVSYVQSMSILNLIKERKYKDNRKTLIAFGGAVYDEISYDKDMVVNTQQLKYLAQNIFEASKKRGTVRNAYGALGYGRMPNLPGTLEEVKNISRVVENTKIFTGDEVTENRIKNLSNRGVLSDYKVIHFATHGIVIPELPELSAVVLSQFKKERGGEDGFLRVEEIAKLKIEADFVNLSACKTGLGKIYGGEGVIGLTQSFLVAGANSVASTLWQVDDTATSQFMVAMYELIVKKKMEYSDAIIEIKRRFINGEFGNEYINPYYWAPFVYYGK